MTTAAQPSMVFLHSVYLYVVNNTHNICPMHHYSLRNTATVQTFRHNLLVLMRIPSLFFPSCSADYDVVMILSQAALINARSINTRNTKQHTIPTTSMGAVLIPNDKICWPLSGDLLAWDARRPGLGLKHSGLHYIGK